MQQRYPSRPEAVPKDFTQPTRAYRRHAWLALGVLVAFVASYVSLCVWFIRTAWRNFDAVGAGGPHSFVGVCVGAVASILALFLLKALFSISRGTAPGAFEASAKDEPELIDFIQRVADETGAPRPHRIFLSPHVNASVSFDLSFINLLFPSKKNLSLGLGLVNALCASELKAVLAHEHGHFAQRTMAVGRWVYVAQQIAAHIVTRRDWFDRGLDFLGSVDIRVAWIGWGLRLVVWSIRAVLDTGFGLVMLAQRALSREMELQADLVAVSVSGSDALIHALHRLGVADTAWDRATLIAGAELQKGCAVPDVFTLQAEVAQHLRSHFLTQFGEPPPLPERERARHRIFEENLFQAPRMWSTHPSNREREDNAKRVYIAAALDDRPAWALFRDPGALRRRMTRELLGALPAPREVRVVSDAEALAMVKARFKYLALDPRYRGVYLGRSVVRDAARVEELYAEAPNPERIAEELSLLYPEALARSVSTLRRLEEERQHVQALRDGALTTLRGVVQHRGRTLARRDVPAVLADVTRECRTARAVVAEHDRRCRAVHRAAAKSFGVAWGESLQSLGALLHYAGHTEADVDDAGGHLMNVLSVISADGRISQGERARLVDAAREVYAALSRVHAARDQLQLPRAVARHLDVPNWAAMFSPQFELSPPSRENIGQWMGVIGSWLNGFSGPLGALHTACLEALLETEAHVSACHRLGQDPGPAPDKAVVPNEYARRCTGAERPRQRQLAFWDRFVTGDGFGPSLARFGVAAAVMAGVLGVGARVTDPTVAVYNGLGIPVQVALGSHVAVLPSHSHVELVVTATDELLVTASTPLGERIESFTADASNGLITHVYNVAGASHLVEWTAVYGNVPPGPTRELGAKRWLTTEADIVFGAPPTQIATRGKGARRIVLGAPDDETPHEMVRAVPLDVGIAMIEAHARWDAKTWHDLAEWLSLAESLPDYAAILEQRLRRDPRDETALLARQNGPKGP